MSQFNQPNRERKIFVWTAKYKRLLEMCIVHHVETKSVFTLQTIKRLVFKTVKSAGPAATFWIWFSKTKNRHLGCLAVTVHVALQERWVATTKEKSRLNFWRSSSPKNNQAQQKLYQKRQKSFHSCQNCVEFPLVDTVNQKFISIFILYTFSLQQTNITFPVYNNVFERSLDFRPDSVTLTIKCFDQKMTISSLKLLLAAWSLLLSQRQEFLNNDLAQFPVTPERKGLWRWGRRCSQA